MWCIFNCEKVKQGLKGSMRPFISWLP